MRFEPGDAHVEDQRAGEAGQGGPVEARSGFAGLLVAGDEGDGAGVLAVRQRRCRRTPSPPEPAVTPGTIS